ncbi:hypothetical protein V8B97DRAFT_972103 [Scleroderma yunnanense]
MDTTKSIIFVQCTYVNCGVIARIIKDINTPSWTMARGRVYMLNVFRCLESSQKHPIVAMLFIIILVSMGSRHAVTLDSACVTQRKGDQAALCNLHSYHRKMPSIPPEQEI